MRNDPPLKALASPRLWGLAAVRGIEFCEFRSEDVVRHPLVARIVDAYELETKRNEDAEKAAAERRAAERETATPNRPAGSHERA